MGMWQRISLIFRSKANKALDRAEDPRETLDYSYQRQLELLSKVRRGVADVATSRKRVELQINQLEQQSAKLQDQAQKAINGQVEDAPRLVEALRRMDIEAPHGRVRFDRYQNVITDIHISRIEKVGDKIQPVVLETVRGVDQFLGQDPVDYMKKPRLIALKGTYAK